VCAIMEKRMSSTFSKANWKFASQFIIRIRSIDIFPSLAPPPPPSRERESVPKREKKRNAVVGRVRFQTSKTSSRDKKAERSIIAILPDVRACLLLLEKWICFREREWL
jgi:hypothetical protein